MENESRQSWALIAIAALGLALGVIALIVAFGAKSTSDGAATQQSVDEVSTELSNLVDRLGIAEASLTGEQQALNGKAKQAATESRNAVANLTHRLNRLERQTAKLNASAKQTTKLAKEVGSLETEIVAVNARVTAVNQRVTKLGKSVDTVNNGGQSAHHE